jgi:hypothetical protein
MIWNHYDAKQRILHRILPGHLKLGGDHYQSHHTSLRLNKSQWRPIAQ